MQFVGILAGIVVIEGLVEYVNMIVVKDENGKHSISWKIIATMAIGIGIAFVFNMDLFSAVGLNVDIPYVGKILTGIFGSRGSNYVHKLIVKLSGVKQEAIELEESLTRPTEEFNAIEVNHEV